MPNPVVLMPTAMRASNHADVPMDLLGTRTWFACPRHCPRFAHRAAKTTVTANSVRSISVFAMRAGKEIHTKDVLSLPQTAFHAQLSNVESMHHVLWSPEDLNVSARKDSRVPIHMTDVLTLTSVKTTFVETMLNVSILSEAMIADVSLDMLATLSFLVHLKSRTKMIYAGIKSVAPMPFVIWDNVFVLKDLKETIHMMLSSDVRLFPRAMSIRIADTMKFAQTSEMDKENFAQIHARQECVDPTPSVSRIITS